MEKQKVAKQSRWPDHEKLKTRHLNRLNEQPEPGQEREKNSKHHKNPRAQSSQSVENHTNEQDVVGKKASNPPEGQ